MIRFRSAGNGNSNARALSSILQTNTSIRQLNLSNTGLDDDGIREICEGIRGNQSITELDLSGNHFGEQGASYLSEALAANNSLRRLDLSRNALGFRSINSLLCACGPKQLLVDTAGNFVFEEILNAVSHGLAFIGAVVGGNLLMSDAAETFRTDYHFWACALYSFSLIFLFLSSCLFHSFFMLPSSESNNGIHRCRAPCDPLFLSPSVARLPNPGPRRHLHAHCGQLHALHAHLPAPPHRRPRPPHRRVDRRRPG